MTQTILTSTIQQHSNQRFYLVEEDQRVLHTGLQLELWQDGKWIAGRVEHALPHGYFFDPASKSTAHRLNLQDGMKVRLTLQSSPHPFSEE